MLFNIIFLYSISGRYKRVRSRSFFHFQFFLSPMSHQLGSPNSMASPSPRSSSQRGGQRKPYFQAMYVDLPPKCLITLLTFLHSLAHPQAFVKLMHFFGDFVDQVNMNWSADGLSIVTVDRKTHYLVKCQY